MTNGELPICHFSADSDAAFGIGDEFQEEGYFRCGRDFGLYLFNRVGDIQAAAY